MMRATAGPATLHHTISLDALGTGRGGSGRSAPTTGAAGRLRLVRLATSTALALAAALLALLVTASPAAAASGPTLITIAGDSLGTPVAVHSDSQPDLFDALLKQLGWMQGAVGTPMSIDQAKLGAKFTVTISAGGDAVQLLDIYPAAAGGPRAFRPATQPKGKTTDAWFYASVSLPDALHAAGVADAGPKAVGVEQVGLQGDDYTKTTTQQSSVDVNLHGEFEQMKTAVLSSVGTSVAALLLLFLAARFSRARYRRRISS